MHLNRSTLCTFLHIRFYFAKMHSTTLPYCIHYSVLNIFCQLGKVGMDSGVSRGHPLGPLVTDGTEGSQRRANNLWAKLHHTRQLVRAPGCDGIEPRRKEGVDSALIDLIILITIRFTPDLSHQSTKSLRKQIFSTKVSPWLILKAGSNSEFCVSN